MWKIETITKKMLSVLPTLHDDLSSGNLDTLEIFKVDYSFTVSKIGS